MDMPHLSSAIIISVSSLSLSQSRRTFDSSGLSPSAVSSRSLLKVCAWVVGLIPFLFSESKWAELFTPASSACDCSLSSRVSRAGGIMSRSVDCGDSSFLPSLVSFIPFAFFISFATFSLEPNFLALSLRARGCGSLCCRIYFEVYTVCLRASLRVMPFCTSLLFSVGLPSFLAIAGCTVLLFRGLPRFLATAGCSFLVSMSSWVNTISLLSLCTNFSVVCGCESLSLESETGCAPIFATSDFGLCCKNGFSNDFGRFWGLIHWGLIGTLVDVVTSLLELILSSCTGSFWLLLCFGSEADGLDLNSEAFWPFIEKVFFSAPAQHFKFNTHERSWWRNKIESWPNISHAEVWIKSGSA